jgi:hypothetical protein
VATYELGWWGLRFKQRETEAAYTTAWTAGMVRPSRVIGAFLLVFNLQALITDRLWMKSADVADRMAWVHVALAAVLAIALALGYTAWGRRHFLDACLVTALTAPLAISAFYTMVPLDILQSQALVGGGQIFALVATLVLGQLGFARGVIASLGFALAFHYILVHVPRPGAEAHDFVLLFHMINATCLLANFLGDRRDRRLYAQEQLLRLERATSERRLREHARTLSGEVRSEVAERSRRLAEALADP